MIRALSYILCFLFSGFAELAVLSLTAHAAACPGSGLSFSCPAGTSDATIVDTIAAASDDAVITFASGTYSWGSTGWTPSNTKGITFQGAGIGNSVVTVTGRICCTDGFFSGTNTKNYRITGFTFKDAPAGSTVFIWGGAEGAWAKNVRMDHNKFQDFASDAIAVIYGQYSPSSQVTGLFDHNQCTGTLHNYVCLKVLGRGTDTNFTTMPQTASVRGTIDNTFVEDNLIDFTVMDGFGVPGFDIWNAGAVVFRYNTVRNAQVGSHGTVHRGGTVNFEAYGNLLIRDSGSNASGANVEEGYRVWEHHGSWESYVWNNTIQHLRTINSQAISMTHYRSADMTEAFGSDITPPDRCDGNTATRDGNTSPTGTYYGYPCWGQPGRAPANGSPVWGTLAPIYVWKNVDDSTGAKVDMVVVDPFSTNIPPVPTTHIVANRDYYNAVSKDAQTSTSSPFDGTTGMGFGTLANRPTTCTHVTSPDGDDGGGVGYFATDQGSWNASSSNPYGVNVAGADGVLYRCSATNTWTAHYIPYTYPHPLQGASFSVEGSGSGLKGGKGLGLF